MAKGTTEVTTMIASALSNSLEVLNLMWILILICMCMCVYSVNSVYNLYAYVYTYIQSYI